MLADHDSRRFPHRGRSPDFLAMAASLMIVAASVFIINAASLRYRVAGLPVASAAVVSGPVDQDKPAAR